MLKNIKKDKKTLSLYILTGIFFFVYSFLSLSAFTQPIRFNSPDETVNYFFAKKFTQTNKIFYFEEVNLKANDVIHPRSTKSINGRVVPTSFLGMIIFYGFLAKIFGLWIIPFLTPLLAVVGVLFFYYFLKNIFSEKIAYLSAILLFFLPPYWYYSSKAMYHNVPFLVFLIIGFYYLSLLLKKNKNSFLFLAGLFFGLALTFRLSEIIWFFLVFLIIGFYYWKKINLPKILFFSLGFLSPLVLMFFYNNILYNNPFSVGYTNQNEQTEKINFLINFYHLILPFGFHIKTLLNNFFNYFLIFFWFVSGPAVLGLFLFFKENYTKREKVYLISYFILFLWLVIYYGSWQIKDNISPSLVTIGNSYVRYWLPMYVFALPFVSFLFLKIAQLNFWKNKVVYLLVVFFALISFRVVFLSPDEGLLKVRDNILGYKKIAKNIYQITESNSIIISRYADKIFFPKRKVVIFNPYNYGAFLGLSKIINENKVYFYDKFLLSKDIDYINERKIKDFQLKIIKKENNFYEVVKR